MSTMLSFLWAFILVQSVVKSDEVLSLEKELKISWTVFTNSSTTQMSYESQRNSILRLYITHNPPVISIIGNPKAKRVKFKGMAIDFVEYVAQHLNLTIEYVIENPTDIEKYGGQAVVAHSLVNNEVDLVLQGMVPTSERLKLFDMTSPIMWDDYRIMVKFPEEKERWSEVAKPFDNTTWCMVAVTIISMVIITTLLAVTISGKCNNNFIRVTAGKKLMYIVGILTNQGDAETTRRLSLRILLGCWLLMTVVLINAYTGILTTHLTVPKWKPIPQTLDELAARNQDYQITLRESYVLTNDILNASSGTYKILGDTLRERPNFLFKTHSEVTDIVLKQNGANLEASSIIAFRIATDYKIHKKCRMTASKQTSHVQSFSAALPKNSPYTKIVEAEVQRANEAGLIDFWKKKYIPSWKQCKLGKQDKDRKAISIPLGKLSSAFVVLGIGLSLAFFVFLLKIIISSLKRVQF